MEKRKVLGRGLDSLLGARRSALAVAVQPVPTPIEEAAVEQVIDGAADESLAANAAADETSGSVIEMQAMAEKRKPAPVLAPSPSPANQVSVLQIADIDRNPYQTRTQFDQPALIELADSIAAQGVLQPILVRPAKVQGRYLLVLGERRLRASKMAGKSTVPAFVRQVNDQQAAELTVIENLQREDLNCIEQAEAFRVLSVGFNLTQAAIAERVGLSRESVANYVRILKLPEVVKNYLAAGAIRFSEARELLRLESSDDVLRLANEMVKLPMQINQLRDRIAEIQQGKIGGARQPNGAATHELVDPNVKAEQTELQRVLGLRVKIRDHNGKGKIEIMYGSVEDYERVVELLRGKG